MQQQLVSYVLSDLNSSSVDITASAVISSDGLPIASMLQANIDPDRVGAMSAALLALVIVKGTDGYILLIQAGEDTVLVVTARESAKLGLILLDARRAARSIVDLESS